MFNDKGEPKMFKEIEENNESKKGGKDNKAILLIIILVLVMVLLVIAYNLITSGMFTQSYSPKTTTHPGFKSTTTTSTSTLNIVDTTTTSVHFTSSTTTTTKAVVQQQIAHKLKISHLSKGEKETYELGPGKEAVVTIKSEKDTVSVELVYNGKKVVTDTLLNKNSLDVYTFGDAFIYVNTNEGSKNYHKIYMVTDLDKETFYEFHEVDGMNPGKMSISGNHFIVYGTRLYDGTKVKYGSITGLDLCNPSNWTGGFTYSSIIETTYTFTLYNNVLNLKPVSSNKVTVQQYLDNNPGLCN